MTADHAPVNSPSQNLSVIPIRSRDDKTSEVSGSLVEQLWFQAYDKIMEEDRSLVKEFEKALSRQLNTSSRIASEIIIEPGREVEIRQLIRTGLERTEKEARLKKGISDTLTIILKAKSMVDSATQAIPYAALAWSGVCLALEVCVYHKVSEGLLTWSRFLGIPQRRLRQIAMASCMLWIEWTGI
jgi:hypothetical protein